MVRNAEYEWKKLCVKANPKPRMQGCIRGRFGRSGKGQGKRSLAARAVLIEKITQKTTGWALQPLLESWAENFWWAQELRCFSPKNMRWSPIGAFCLCFNEQNADGSFSVVKPLVLHRMCTPVQATLDFEANRSQDNPFCCRISDGVLSPERSKNMTKLIIQIPSYNEEKSLPVT